MEYRDAIDVIKEHLSDIRCDAELYEKGIGGISDALEEFAIPAMEKEIARDVVVENAISRRQYYACPECAEFLRWRYINEKHESIYHPGRCPWCGQTLNWR
jgi:rubrerythrin